MRFFRRLAEFGDVGPGKECPAFSDNQNGAHPIVCLGLSHPVPQPLAHRVAERVHWRVLHRQNGDAALTVIRNLVAQSVALPLPRLAAGSA